MLAAGLDCDERVAADGKLHRFKASNDREPNSWFVLYPGPPVAGAFGCWKRDLKETWCERGARAMSQVEWQRVREQWRRADTERDRAEAGRHAEAREEAARILNDAKPPQSHAYLDRKSVKLFGDVREHRGRLVLPLRDASGELHSLQFIGADGAKKFLTGGRIAGCFFTLCDKANGPIVLCEGYATAASICEATGLATVAAMNCGNLPAVAKALRARWPACELIVAADDDRETPGNPGLTKASEAAKAVGAKLAVPKFKDISTKPTDFNDLAASEGLDAVKTQIDNVTSPTATANCKPGSLAAEYLDTEPAAERQVIEPPLKYSPPPLTLLPCVLRDYVRAIAESLDVDVAFVFLPILSALAAAIGNSRNLRVKKGFVQPAILWTAIVARSGSKKSPALSAATTFSCARERELLRLNAAAETVFEQQHREWDATPKKARGEEPKPPPRLTCLLDDLTLAVVAPILRDNPRGVLVAKDELASWLGSFGQFSKTAGGAAADVSGWLSLFNGERLLLDRKTNRESHRIFHPRLSIAGCIPPSVLRGALTKDFFQRGLPARIFFAAPPPRANVWTDAEVPAGLESAAAAIFRRLFALEADEREDGPVPVELSVAPDGLELFRDFYNRVGHHAVESGEREEAAWSKLTGGAARLSLVGHLAHGLDGIPVGGPLMEAAVELASWFGHEAERMYASFHESPGAALCRRLVEFLERRSDLATVREIADNFRPLKNQTEEIERYLNGLVASQRGEWLPSTAGEKGGRPTRRFRLFSDAPACPCPGNPENALENSGFTDTDTPGVGKNGGFPDAPAPSVENSSAAEIEPELVPADLI